MNFFRRYQFFLTRTIAFIAIAFLVILFTKKHELHVTLNQYHSLFFDLFFKLVTHLGDGIFLAIIALVFIFVHIRTTIALAIGGIFSALVVQVMKRAIFPDAMRPVKCIGDIDALHLVDNVTMLTHHSFPSGHAATAFIIAGGLSLFFKSALQQKWLTLFAVIIAYSRVYLSLHFLEDITVGALIGTITALCGLYISEKINLKGFERVNIPSLIRKK